MDTSILFGGLHFDKKRFAADINKFKTKDVVEPELLQKANLDESGSEKKGFLDCTIESKMSSKSSASSRKRQWKLANEKSVNLFKKIQVPMELIQAEDNKDLQIHHKQQQCRKAELAAFLRKQNRIHISGHDIPFPLNSFKELKTLYGCKPYLMSNLLKAGYKEPTAIQRQAVPVLLSDRECFACAPTGSGKTLAFIIPILMKLKAPRREGIRAVVLCPTRELAKQITEEFKHLVRGKKFRIRLMSKTLCRCADFRDLPCDILISTPLRLDSLLSQSKIDLSSVEHLVLDESDKLFELGFVEQIDAVINACSNPSILRSLFSATLPDSVEELARTIMHSPVRIVVGEKNSASQTIHQRLVFVGSEEGKILALRHIFQESLLPPILLFVQSKERAKELQRELAFEDVQVDCIHADLTQSQRERAVERFREGKTWLLIATDLMARGMDFKGVNCVINFDFPKKTSVYIHRIGRSGRAGRRGEAITLYTEDDVPYLRPVVNVMVASGCDVPLWMHSLPKKQKTRHISQLKRISKTPLSKKTEYRSKSGILHEDLAHS